MIIGSVNVKNFRSILDETLHCEQLTALVGANGSGKSSFLRALELFYNPSPKIEAEDFYNGDTSVEIVIAITFKDLGDEARELFSKYLQGDLLRVERVFTWDAGKITAKYHGASLQNPEFEGVREGLAIRDRGKTAREAYENLHTKPEYASLPTWPRSLTDVPDILNQWEESNPEKCVRERDDGQFFGFKEVAQGYLGRYTRLLFIPAVRDAADDAAEKRGSVLTDLMDLVVRSVIANKEAVQRLKEETQRQYEHIMDPANLAELTTLADRMTATLRTFVPDASVDLRWFPLEGVSIPMPKADVKLIEDGYQAAVARTGHGLQRAFILTMLQHLAIAQTGTETSIDVESERGQPEKDARVPNLVLVIEEPELYQHPNRQRHFAKILLQLASGKTPGVADKTQIIYSTHSPLFVGIDRIDQIRLLRKIVNVPDKPKATYVVSTSIDMVAEEVWRADGEPIPKYTGGTLLPRLHAIMTPWMSEGFFADVVVLVEGEDDRAAILGIAKAKGHDLESMGFSVIPCGGKTSLDRPAVIFDQLGIPVYLIWDGDKGEKDAKPEDNHRLLRLMKWDIEDWPCWVHDRFACFEKNLETTLRREIGEAEFDQSLLDCQNGFCIPKKKHATKNPAVIETIIQNAEKMGRTSHTLSGIVERIIALKALTNTTKLPRSTY